ncbi:hypothetical protein [Streptomyces sp. enrichment culture]|uniref:hypothetical protein n=1 Tax=Streptomyces sp. enrichment culture TaxID=1795815 RepID=UPI003F56AE1F
MVSPQYAGPTSPSRRQRLRLPGCCGNLRPPAGLLATTTAPYLTTDACRRGTLVLHMPGRALTPRSTQMHSPFGLGILDLALADRVRRRAGTSA